MYIAIRLIAIVLVFIFVEDATAQENVTDNNVSSKVLSRRKRFLIFPDGSSFQLVFCAQNHGYLQIGDIVWFGNTAALAWELPSDPALFQMFRENSKDYQELANRRSDVIYYLDEDGRVIDKKPYKKKKIIVNPAFAKRSLEDGAENKTVETKLSIKEMHKKHASQMILKDLDANRLQFHREGRKDLYGKLETLFESMGWNGRDCVQRMLCESGQFKNEHQGSFLTEITRAVFTLPKIVKSEPDVEHYDDAHGANGDCARLYPECGDINVL